MGSESFIRDSSSRRMIVPNSSPRIVVTVLFARLLAGCASQPVEIQPFDKSVTVEKSFDEGWSNLVRFLSTNDVNISTIEKDSGLISLRGENLTGSLIAEYCDTAGAAPFLYSLNSGKATGSVTVVNDDGFATVNANIRFQATYVYGMSNPPQYTTKDCVSRGAFETALLGSIQ